MTRKLYVAAALGLVALVALAGTIAWLHVRYEATHQAYRGLMHVHVNVLRMRSDAKDFIALRELRFAEGFKRHSVDLERSLREVRALGMLPPEGLAQVRTPLAGYAEAFTRLVEASQRIGLDEESGAHGELRLQAHLVEALLTSLQDPPASVVLLQMRRREKDFIQRLDDDYARRFDKLAERLLALEVVARREPLRRAILAYCDAFHELVSEWRKVGLTSESGLRLRMHLASRRFDAAAGQMVSAVEARIEAAQASLRSAAIVAFGLFLSVVLALMAWVRRLIAAQRRLAQGLSARENQLATTLASIGDGVIATDVAGRVARMNPTAEALTGWSAREACGRPIGEVFAIRSGLTGAPAEIPVASVLESGEVRGLANDTLLVSRDGTERMIADSAAPIRAEPGAEIRGVVMVFRDITRRHELEAQLRQAQKMESIGLLAGGIAHDFNNMLTGILGASEILVETARDDEQRELSETIFSTAQSAAALTQELLSFARRGKLVSSPVDMHQLLEDALAILERTLGQRIAIERSLEAPQAGVVGDPAQLKNALLNLGINASEELADGGTLRITTRQVDLDAQACSELPFALSPGLYVELCFAPTGERRVPSVRGGEMPGDDATAPVPALESALATVRGVREAGLSLSAVYAAAEAHGGAVRNSRRAGGAPALSLCLPLSPAAPAAPAPEPSRVVESACVLVVDDEFVVRTTMQSLLERLGHRVVLAEDGLRALELYAGGDAIDLVILDLMMPGMGGREVFTRLRQQDPAVRVLFSSGFTSDPDDQLLSQPGVRGFLPKPFTRKELAAALQAALAGQTG